MNKRVGDGFDGVVGVGVRDGDVGGCLAACSGGSGELRMERSEVALEGIELVALASNGVSELAFSLREVSGRRVGAALPAGE